ncbi:MAG: rhomboid family intramembrane serine protease [Planctomycetota bacterium]
MQIWRLITYQFLHGDASHLFGNMLGVYIFGSMLESHFGSKKFIVFYLICGALGGILYIFLVNVNILKTLPMIGASGAIYGVLAAVAILFPRNRVYIFGVYPIPISVLALIYFLLTFFSLIKGENVGGQVAHLTGMAAGAVYVLRPYWKNITALKHRPSRQDKKMYELRNLQMQVDHILQKVHDHGIQSLTSKEKRILKQATKIQREQDRL